MQGPKQKSADHDFRPMLYCGPLWLYYNKYTVIIYGTILHAVLFSGFSNARDEMKPKQSNSWQKAGPWPTTGPGPAGDNQPGYYRPEASLPRIFTSHILVGIQSKATTLFNPRCHKSWRTIQQNNLCLFSLSSRESLMSRTVSIASIPSQSPTT